MEEIKAGDFEAKLTLAPGLYLCSVGGDPVKVKHGQFKELVYEGGECTVHFIVVEEGDMATGDFCFKGVTSARLDVLQLQGAVANPQHEVWWCKDLEHATCE
jgi:hypothetical protein